MSADGTPPVLLPLFLTDADVGGVALHAPAHECIPAADKMRPVRLVEFSRNRNKNGCASCRPSRHPGNSSEPNPSWAASNQV